jgi:hypothetical protein
VEKRCGILSRRYASKSAATVGTLLRTVVAGVGAERNNSAASHALLFVGYSDFVPMSLLRRLPFSHQRKFHVLRRLSKTTDPR